VPGVWERQAIRIRVRMLSDMRLAGDDICWLEGRPWEQGRNVIVRAGPDGAAADITPAAFNVRTRAHEYGSGSWLVAGGTWIFSNFADQRLYRQRAGQSDPEPLTPAPLSPKRHLRYSDGVLDRGRRRWIGVREDHTDEGEPNMPWNGTTLYLADIGADGAPAVTRAIAGSVTESVFQPESTSTDARTALETGRPRPLRCEGCGEPRRQGPALGPDHSVGSGWAPLAPRSESVNPWAAAAAAAGPRASTPWPPGRWRWHPGRPRERSAGPRPDRTATRPDTRDQPRGPCASGRCSYRSKRRTVSPGTAPRRHGKISISRPYVTDKRD